MKEAPGLVDPLGFILPVYKNQYPGKRSLKIGLSLYDALAGRRQHSFLDSEKILEKIPHIKQQGLSGGFHFFNDFLGHGLNGSVYGKRSKVEEFTLKSFVLKNANVAFPNTENVFYAKQIKDRNGSIAGNITAGPCYNHIIVTCISS